MKVHFLLRGSQIDAIRLLANIDGTILSDRIDGMQLIEYDITTDKIMMLESLLSQQGSIVKEEKKWPSEGDDYYYIDSTGSILHTQWDMINDIPTKVDLGRRDIGNIFKTKEEAEFEKERLKVLNQLKSLSDDDQEWYGVKSHYHIVYDLDCEMFRVWSSNFTKLPCSNIYFKSKESAEAAIKTIGEDRLKKYVFNIKEN